MAIRIIPIISLIFLAFVAFGQSDAVAAGELDKSPLAEEFDKKAMEKLKKMSPEEVEALDKKLAEALTLLYDREYVRALPIFKEISGRVETMDVMFWLASTAAKTGDTETAFKKFRQMLDVDPNLHRVRLEMATVYFGMGRYADARRELNTVLEAKPPEAVKQNIEKLLAGIDAKTKKVFANLRVSFGYQHDSNVSAGPDKEFVDVPGGGTLGPLTNTQKKLADNVLVIGAAGNVLYDIGESKGLMWNTTGSLYTTHANDYYEFDFTQVRATTGLWWVGRQSVLKVPVGYAENMYEHDHLFDTLDFSPTYEYFFTPKFSLRGLVSHSKDQYIPVNVTTGAESTGQDNTNRILEINPNFFFNNRNDTISFYLSDEMLKANARRWSYDATNAAVSYFKHFSWWSWDMEFYARYKYTRREYLAPALLWPAGHLRTDTKHNYYAVLSRNFTKNCFASIHYNLIDNRSNTGLYDFEKYTYGLTIGVKF